MVKLRLTRVGKKKQPSYRLVAAPSRSPRDGRFIEILGHYNPLTNPPTVVFKEERIMHWLKEGAQPTESVQKLLTSAGIWQKFTGKPVTYPAPKQAAPAPTPEPEPANA
ncbi:MAG: 30S ribosomal protein S16 [Vulcanimicrobiota bacterium]